MRTIIILILYVIITILSLPMYLIEAIVRLISPRAAAHIAQVIVKGAFNLVMFVSGRVTQFVIKCGKKGGKDNGQEMP